MAIPEWKTNLLNDLLERKTSLAVIGLGYAGLPLALAFGKKMQVTGFDIDTDKVMQLRRGIDPSGEMKPQDFVGTSVEYTCYPEVLARSRVYVINVPTPVDEFHVPVLQHLVSASQAVGKGLKRGDLVIYESTVYPGCTEENCIPVLEKVSGLKACADFKFGFSPERINPGEKEHNLSNTVKVIAGCDPDALKLISALYRQIIKAGVHPVSSIKVAETAKIIENTQRDLNIALVNELSIICNKLNINTHEALEAAGTKWNFLKFSPGLVGGHCVGIDPHYLAYKAQQLGYHPHVILAGRHLNDSMGAYIARQTAKKLLALGTDLRQAKILVMGFTFKENISDIRNTRVADLIKELSTYQAVVTVTDPRADIRETRREYGLDLAPMPGLTSEIHQLFDAVIVAVAHKEYTFLTQTDFGNFLKPGGLLVDVKGIYKGGFSGFGYWSL